MEYEKRIIMLDSTADCLPEGIRQLIKKLSLKTKSRITEIRLRAGKPLVLTMGNESVFVSKEGNICYLFQHGLYFVSADEVKETFKSICDYSVYAYSQQIKSGYITLKNGCRAGFAASAVYENGKLLSFTSVSSINIRIAGEYIGCAIPLLKYLQKGLIIAGPPAAGKTTLLRDCVRLVSNGLGTARRRVAVVDTRGEIASVNKAVPQNDVGLFTDIITGCEKAEGIEIALRTLNPEIIAFDEIGSDDESRIVIKSFFSGVNLLTTVHLGSIDEIKSRPAAYELINSCVVSYVCFTEYAGAPLKIYEVIKDNSEVSLVLAEKENVNA